jgi:hypothetical protein
MNSLTNLSNNAIIKEWQINQIILEEIKMKFYATGTMKVTTTELDEKNNPKEVSRIAHIVIRNDNDHKWESRLETVNDVKAYARANGISNVDVRPIGKVDAPSTMTKNAKERRAKRALQHKKNWIKKQKIS